MTWSLEKKIEIEKAIGSSEYASSDESDYSEDEDGNTILSAYLVKKLPWERSVLTNIKKRLDEAYFKSLNRRARVNLVARRAHSRPSTRCSPKEGLEWAVRLASSAVPTPPSTSTSSPATPSTSTRPTATPSTSTKPQTTPSVRTRPPATPSASTRPPATPSARTKSLTTPLTTTRARPPATPTSGTRAAVSPAVPTLPSGSSLIPRASSTPRTTLVGKKNYRKLKKNTVDRSSEY